MLGRIKGHVLLALFACLVFALGSPSLAGPATPDAPAYTGCGGERPSVTNASFEEQLVELVNTTRDTNGLPPLKRNSDLDDAARYFAVDMAQDNYTPADHKTYDRAGGSLVAQCEWNDRVKLYYNPFASLKENIAWGQTTPQAAMDWWMNSPAHKKNILSDEVWEIGVGFAANQGGAGPYWAKDFGRQNGVYPVVVNGEAAKTTSRMVSIHIYGDWTEMRFQNDGGAWSNWAAFQAEPIWTVSADSGLKKVCVQMRTGLGTPVESCDTITLDMGSQPPPGSETKVYLPYVAKSYYGGAPGWQIIMEDNFDSQADVPWVGQDMGTGPGSYLWDFSNCRASSGKFSAWAVANYKEGPNLPCFGHYPNDLNTWLTYGPFSLAGATQAELRFQGFVHTQADYKDYFFYGASIDGIAYSGYSTSGDSSGWVSIVLDLADVPQKGDLTGRSQVWIGFALISDGSVTYPEGALVDDVVLRKWVGPISQSRTGGYADSAFQDWPEGLAAAEKVLER